MSQRNVKNIRSKDPRQNLCQDGESNGSDESTEGLVRACRTSELRDSGSGSSRAGRNRHRRAQDRYGSRSRVGRGRGGATGVDAGGAGGGAAEL